MDEHGNIIIYKDKNGNDNIEVKLQDNTVWLNQKQLVRLYNSSKSNISEHIKHIFEEGELDELATVRKFRTVASNGKTYNMNYYNLDMIVAIGFRVKSNTGTNFRKWANERLTEYMIKGFAMNDDLLKRAGGGLYFDELLARIRDIRSSEKVFWRKILDIYATSVDYDPKSKLIQEFFKTVQNKMHWAVHGHTAAEIIYNRADSKKEHMGLTNWKNSPNGKILETDVVIAKNYLSKRELEQLELIVSAFLDLAEARAKRHIPMTMEDWSTRIDKFLLSDDRDILKDAGKISDEIACDKALTEFEKYRVKQDKLYKSDFDLLLEESSKVGDSNGK